MLNKETKKKIDNCRNILVGVLPLPTDQVELITIALIYKFMDDMDEQSLQLNGNPSFFIKSLKEFSWQKLMSNQLSGEQRVQLFVKALEEFSKAPHLLEFFRSIFRNTFLKFRDGRVFKLFLDEINYFSYDNSEELGNAFEYLLNTMGAQGENGQFRTPRNIIDFIVEVVDPDKDDKILDPACGTSGFLISAYKHILRKYTTGYENYRISLNNQVLESNGIHWGDKLLAAQKSKLAKRIEGYDNTPLMVRLSQVNMYLHNFPNPSIHDYDSLTYTNRWNDKYDCILANPPFMSPQGGVMPHKQFRIRAKKTEILFSDYIIEHLTPNGKAGWIVPEGIIFQNSNDYVELRKWLINDLGLWAVVSLPAQIFQPYSGVKTSILLVDRALARVTENIILVKIDNDGFSLNTNRNPIKDNDLPAALNLLTAYKKNPSVIPSEASNLKYKILHRKDFAKLDSYKSTTAAVDFCKKEFKELKKAEEKYLESLEKELPDKQRIKTEERIKSIRQTFLNNTRFDSLPADENSIKQFVEDQLKEEVILYGENPVYHPNLSPSLKKYIDWQREYNLSFDKYFNDSNNPNNFRLNLELVKLGDERYFRIESGGTPDTNNSSFWGDDVNWVTLADLPTQNSITIINSTKRTLSYSGLKNSSAKILPVGSVLVSSRATIGRIAINRIPLATNQGFRSIVINDIEKVNSMFVALCLTQIVDQMISLGSGATYKEISITNFRSLEIPLPPIEVQQKIVAEIEQYQKVIDGCNLVIQNYKPTFKIDESWEKKKLDEVCDLITDGTHLKPTYVESGIKFLSSKNVTSGIIDWSDIKYISEREHKLLSKRASPKRNDILLAKNGTTGIAALNDTDEIFDIYVSLALLRPMKEIYPLFLLYVVNSDIVKVQFNSRLKGIGVPNLHLNEIKDVEIHLPPLAEQQKIVSQIESEMQAVEQCKRLKTQMENKIKEVIDSVWQSNSKEILI